MVKAYSIYDDEVGYTQGLQFIVGPLLLNVRRVLFTRGPVHPQPCRELGLTAFSFSSTGACRCPTKRRSASSSG